MLGCVVAHLANSCYLGPLWPQQTDLRVSTSEASHERVNGLFVDKEIFEKCFSSDMGRLNNFLCKYFINSKNASFCDFNLWISCCCGFTLLSCTSTSAGGRWCFTLSFLDSTCTHAHTHTHTETKSVCICARVAHTFLVFVTAPPWCS